MQKSRILWKLRALSRLWSLNISLRQCVLHFKLFSFHMSLQLVCFFIHWLHKLCIKLILLYISLFPISLSPTSYQLTMKYPSVFLVPHWFDFGLIVFFRFHFKMKCNAQTQNNKLHVHLSLITKALKSCIGFTKDFSKRVLGFTYTTSS